MAIIYFAKVQATGNDFVMIDAGQNSKRWFSQQRIRTMCDRKFGIGADGLILLQKHNNKNRLSMDYFNADGSKAEVCGNGIRASALFAYISGMIMRETPYTLKTGDGNHKLMFNNPDEITVEIKIKSGVKHLDEGLFKLPDDMRVLGFVNTGVPHLVVQMNNPATSEAVTDIGRYLRNHDHFKPDGANVNFVEFTNAETIGVRTYERGVEEETLSCGTGAAATALLLWRQYPDLKPELSVRTRGGTLKLRRIDNAVFLSGPARIVFSGQWVFSE